MGDYGHSDSIPIDYTDLSAYLNAPHHEKASHADGYDAALLDSVSLQHFKTNPDCVANLIANANPHSYNHQYFTYRAFWARVLYA